jgi:penicillin-binding protein 2
VTRLASSGAAHDSHFDRRVVLAMLIVVAVWGALLGRLFYLQVVEGERHRKSAERNSVRTHRLIAPRGMILDRSGMILVDSRPSHDVLVVPHETPSLDTTLERIAGLIGASPAELAERVGRPTGRSRFQAQPVMRDLDRDALARVESRLWALPGVLTQVTPIRDHRFGSAAAHLLGRLGEISRSQLEQGRSQGYRPGDSVGKAGVERLLDQQLRGRNGGENVLVDAHGRELERWNALEPQPGENVVLSLDLRLQLVAERAFDELGKHGALVALDPRNGDVLALMSRPNFDPNLFARGIERDEWAALRDSPAKPLHNRVLQGMYPPGSTYKVVTALAGLETGTITPEQVVDCKGSYRLGRRRYRCWKRWGHGEVDLHKALVQSCDVYFYQLGEALGVDTLAYYARALGLGAATGIELGAESSGLVPTRAWKERRFGQKWIKGETISIAIGQGFNLWTPLQMASAYAAIGNGGTRFRPFVVKRIESATGQVISETTPEVVSTVPISPGSLLVVQSALRGVVHDERGTGRVMRRLPVEVAGKTGTAQVVALAKDPVEDNEEIPEAHRDHAWFVGWAPAEAPRIVVAVLVEHGGHGGSAAAPVARKVMAEFFEREGQLHAGN